MDKANGNQMDKARVESLGKWVARHSQFKWMAGMLVLWEPAPNTGPHVPSSARLFDCPYGLLTLPVTHGILGVQDVYEGAWPDVRDPATQGCILSQVMEKLGDRTCVRFNTAAGWWEVVLGTGVVFARDEDYGSVLALALVYPWSCYVQSLLGCALPPSDLA